MSDDHALLQSDLIGMLGESQELAEWDSGWADAQKVFEGVTEEAAGARNAGRLPFIEIGYPALEHDELSTSDYGGRLRVMLRCRLARGHSESGGGREAGEMFSRIFTCLGPALTGGTANCKGLRNGSVSIVEAPRPCWDGRALQFDAAVEWFAPRPHS